MRTKYIPFDRDPDRARTPDWYQQTLPAAVSYTCDGTTPAIGFHYDWGFLTPIDTESPQVRDEVFARHVEPAKRAGYDGIAFDNLSGTNDWRRCGVRRDGRFVQQYSGAVIDRSYTESVRAWAAWMREKSHAVGLSVALNISYSRNDPDAFGIVAREGDVVVNESGFSRECKPWFLDGDWRRRFAVLRQVARERGLVLIDYACKTFGDITPRLVEWSLANYHMVRGDRTYLALTGLDDLGAFHDRPELHVALGRAVGEPVEVDGLWRRDYERGFVALNPSSTRTGRLDLGATSWRRINGATVSGVVELPPATGLVLEALSEPGDGAPYTSK